jgi:transcriptional regulator of NAD metabolism
MTMRVLDQAVSYDEDMRGEIKQLKSNPNGEALLNLLGAVRDGSHENSVYLNKELKRKCRELAEAFELDDEQVSIAELLRNPDVDPATRLGEAMVALN